MHFELDFGDGDLEGKDVGSPPEFPGRDSNELQAREAPGRTRTHDRRGLPYLVVVLLIERDRKRQGRDGRRGKAFKRMFSFSLRTCLLL